LGGRPRELINALACGHPIAREYSGRDLCGSISTRTGDPRGLDPRDCPLRSGDRPWRSYPGLKSGNLFAVGWSRAMCAGISLQADGTVASERRPFQSGRGSGMCARARWLSLRAHRFAQNDAKLPTPGAGLAPPPSWQTDDRGGCPWRCWSGNRLSSQLGLFLGGHLEANRPPEQALRLELKEESTGEIQEAAPLVQHHDSQRSAYFFRGRPAGAIEALELLEGQDMVSASLNENGHAGDLSTPMLDQHVPLAPSLRGHASDWSWKQSGLASAGNVRPLRLLQAVRIGSVFVVTRQRNSYHLRRL